jgi:hypothetical protein
MRKLLLLILTLSLTPAIAQVKKLKVEKEKPVKSLAYAQTTFDLYYGNRIYINNYYSQLNTVSKTSLSTPPMVVGLGISGYHHYFGARSRMKFFSNYYKVIPATVMIEDSFKTTLSGFVFGAAVGPSFSNSKKTLNLNIYLGFNTGRTTLINNEYISQKNPFFSPKISIQPKIMIKRFAISLIVEAEYDVSNPAWKSKRWNSKDPHQLLSFNQTCYTAIISVGYRPY